MDEVEGQIETVCERGGNELRQGSRMSIRWLLGLAIIYTLYLARGLILPILLALLMAVLLMPVVHRLVRWRIPAVAAAAIVSFAFAGVAAGLIYLLAQPAQTWIERGPEAVVEIREKLLPLTESLRTVSEATEEIEEATGLKDPSVTEVAAQKPSMLLRFAVEPVRWIGLGLASFTLLFFLLAFGREWLGRVMSLGEREAQVARRAVVKDVSSKVSRFLYTITIINGCLGAAVGLVLGLLGMPNPVLWGAMAALLNYIPYFGFFVGVILVAFAAILSFDSAAYAALCPLAYATLNALEANVVTPCLVGRSLSLNPIMIFLSVLVWTWIWGVAGAVLAVPILACIKIICESSDPLKPVVTLLKR